MAVISYISGPIVKAALEGEKVSLMELTYIGETGLIGEVVELEQGLAVIQVYENTEGLKLGERVSFTKEMLCAMLGPGLLGSVLDGIGRSLNKIGERIEKGLKIDSIEREKKWHFKPLVTTGTTLKGGEIIGEVAETENFSHKIIFPKEREGTVEAIKPQGEYTIEESVLVTKEGFEQKLFIKHPIRIPRSYKERLTPDQPLVTGQRVIDFLFPLVKGGTAAIPGGFGTGKTILQQALAKMCDADIIIYIGCGERGNEMTEVLEEFPDLVDKKNGRKLIERTVLIANTSDMPVSAREASMFLGITIGEYYRDMGYHVALMADSTSRWAEAMRELSGRMNELPVEEGFPAYLASKIASVYERAGYVTTESGRRGSVSMIGAVSPPGGDMSEPVTRHTRRYTGTFWALDKELASARFYPAINYMHSYTGYKENTKSWWESIDGDTTDLQDWMVEILQEDDKLQKIVKLLGSESLPEEQKRIVETASLIKEIFLQQNAFDDIDMYSTPERIIAVAELLHLIDGFWQRCLEERQIPMSVLKEQEVIERFIHSKFKVENQNEKFFQNLEKSIIECYDNLLVNYGV